MAPEPLYSLISTKFTTSALKDLCKLLAVDYEDLGGEAKKMKALNLQEYMSNRGRLGELLAVLDRQGIRNLDLKPYLYLIVAEEFYSESLMTGLIEGFGLTVKDFGGKEKFPRGSEQWREHKAQHLQEYMSENNRVPEFLTAIHQQNADVDLSFYGDVTPPPPAPAVPQQPVVQAQPVATSSVPAGQPTGETEAKQALKATEYKNFNLRIRSAHEGTYPIEVTESPEGETDKAVYKAFPLDDDDFIDQLDYLTDLLAKPEESKAFGRTLRELLFPGEVWDLFQGSWRVMRAQKKGLRVRLRIDPPELSKLPWEYCYDDKMGFFALKREMPVVRYVAEQFAAETLAAPRPLKILVAMASPEDLAPLDVKAEEAWIRKALEDLGDLVELSVLPDATALKLQEALADNHILHYIGHGIMTDGGQGALALHGETGGMQPLDAEQMRVMMENSGIKVVILNACKTAAHGTADALLGVAPSLVRAGIPAVMAMQFNVPDETGILFARTLYTFLAAGEPLDAAVTEMRISAYIGDNNKVYWAIPVLFMRAPDGVIWQPTEPDEATEKPAAVRLVERVVTQNVFNIGKMAGDIVEGEKQVTGDQIHGDAVEGDKIDGDKVGGDKVAGDKIVAGGNVIQGGVNISGVSGGSAVSLTGDAVVGTQVKDVTGDVTVGSGEASREDFTELMATILREFEAVKAQLPADDADDAADELADVQQIAAAEKPNARRLVRKLSNVTEILAAAGGAAAAASQLTPLLENAVTMAKSLFGG